MVVVVVVVVVVVIVLYTQGFSLEELRQVFGPFVFWGLDERGQTLYRGL